MASSIASAPCVFASCAQMALQLKKRPLVGLPLETPSLCCERGPRKRAIPAAWIWCAPARAPVGSEVAVRFVSRDEASWPSVSHITSTRPFNKCNTHTHYTSVGRVVPLPRHVDAGTAFVCGTRSCQRSWRGSNWDRSMLSSGVGVAGKIHSVLRWHCRWCVDLLSQLRLACQSFNFVDVFVDDSRSLYGQRRVTSGCPTL